MASALIEVMRRSLLLATNPRTERRLRARTPLGAAALAALLCSFLPPSARAESLRPPLGEFISAVTDRAVDEDGDGLFDALELTFSVDIQQEGSWAVGAVVTDPAGLLVIRTGQSLDRAPGEQAVVLRIDGTTLHRRGLEGPYTVDLELRVGDHARTVAQLDPPYTTQAYHPEDFDPPAVEFSGEVTDETVPLAENPGLLGDLKLRLGLVIHDAGTYSVQATLATQKEILRTSTSPVQGDPGPAEVVLIFDRESIYNHRADGPYLLRTARILDVSGNLIEFGEDMPTGTGAVRSTQFAYGSVTVDTGSFRDEAVDDDGDGLNDRLLVHFRVTAEETNLYIVNASLKDADTRSVARSQRSVTLRATGARGGSGEPTEVVLSFDGGAIRESGRDGPYHLSFVSFVSQTGEIADHPVSPHVTGTYRHGTFGSPPADAGEE
jgi:hypothetical protein